MAAPAGNSNAKRGTEWRNALRQAMAHKADGDYRQTLTKIAASVVDMALAGDKDAWKEIAEREDGKAAQAHIVANEDGETFKIEKVKRVIVDPRDTDSAGIQTVISAVSV